MGKQIQTSLWDRMLDRIDWIVAARGASTGFGVLVISGLIQPMLMNAAPWVALPALLLGSLLGFVAAGYRAGPAPSPPATGAVAALFAYTLTIPLSYLVHQPLAPSSVAGFVVAALLVGSATGAYMGRREQARREAARVTRKR